MDFTVIKPNDDWHAPLQRLLLIFVFFFFTFYFCVDGPFKERECVVFLERTRSVRMSVVKKITKINN